MEKQETRARGQGGSDLGKQLDQTGHKKRAIWIFLFSF